LDWVRALDFSPPGTSAPTTISSSDAPSSELLLASGSQDGYIRLWSLTPLSPAEEKNVKENEEGDGEAEGEGAELDDKMLEDFERKIGGGEDGQEGDVGQVSMKAFVLQVKAKDGS
jgi:WD40 repeat protein